MLAARVTALREKDGLTQNEIALRAGLPVATIMQIESGESDELPYIEFLLLAKYFGCPELLADKSDKSLEG